MTEDVVKGLLGLAEAVPLMGPKLGQAATLVKEALAEFLAASSTPPSSPTGPQFPGGGFGKGKPF